MHRQLTTRHWSFRRRWAGRGKCGRLLEKTSVSRGITRVVAVRPGSIPCQASCMMPTRVAEVKASLLLPRSPSDREVMGSPRCQTPWVEISAEEARWSSRTCRITLVASVRYAQSPDNDGMGIGMVNATTKLDMAREQHDYIIYLFHTDTQVLWCMVLIESHHLCSRRQTLKLASCPDGITGWLDPG